MANIPLQVKDGPSIWNIHSDLKPFKFECLSGLPNGWSYESKIFIYNKHFKTAYLKKYIATVHCSHFSVAFVTQNYSSELIWGTKGEIFISAGEIRGKTISGH